MALDDFQMPSFKDPDGTTYIWDSASKSYVKAPLTDKRPDQSHATGGDNDLFDPFQHTEMDSVPELEGYMAKSAQIDDPPFPSPHEVKCPNCGETTEEHVCPNCQKDLTPEWNTQGQDNEFFDVHHDFNDAKEFWTWPQNVPKKNELNYDDSFPSMSLSKTAEAMTDDWDSMFADEVPTRIEVGKWILDVHGQLHIGQGNITHPQIEQRDGLDQTHEIALGSVYNDGTADVQMVFQPNWFNLEATQPLIEQAFGPVELQPPMGQAEQKGQVFPIFEITEGQWFIAPQTQTITGIAWVKERSNGVEYNPSMILCAEHLRDDDFMLYHQGAACIVTAFGGGASHAAYLAMTSGIPVVTGIGESYNKVETGNYLKIDPASETITVIPGLTGDASSEQKQQVWNSILDYQRQRGGSVSHPQFSHFHEELAWKEANAPNLEDCPECSAPMMDQDGESVCHDCGHKQPIIHAAGAAALAVPELLGAGEAASGAAAGGGGISGIGSMMKGALGRGMAFQTGKNLIGGGGDAASNAVNAEQPTQFDPNAGTVASQKFAKWDMQHQAFLSEIWGLIQNAIQAAKAAGGNIPWNQLGAWAAANPVDDALFAGAAGGLGAAKENAQNQLQQVTGALGDDNVGLATDNDGTNSTDEASNSGTEGKKEQGDGPEQLKDVDGGHDSQDKDSGDNLQADPQLQDKALKAFHMNLPLVIEFANSEEEGANHPILQALDALLEEAFPGYKDGMDDEAGATDEHPEEEKSDEASDSEPDAKSEGDDKQEIHIHTKKLKEGVWHYAWDPDPGYDEREYSDPAGGDTGPGGAYICPNCETPTNDFGEGMWFGKCQRCGEDLVDNDGGLSDPYDDYDAYDGPGEYEMYGPDRPTMREMFPHEAKTAAGGPEAWNMRRTLDGPWDAYQEEQAPQTIQPHEAPSFGQGQWQQFEGPQGGAPEAYSCMNCGEQHEFPGNTDPRELPACPQCGARSWTHSGLQQTYAKTSTLDPGQPMGQPVPAGAGGPAMEMCPRCGQAHTPGSPCPVADVTTPITTGEGMAAAPATHVVTKWHLAMPANVPASQPQQAAGAPAAPQTCPSCGCNHIPGTPCPTYNQQGTQQPAATGGQPANLATPQVGPGVQYSHVAAEDGHIDDSDTGDSDQGDYHSEDDWMDDSGAPLEEGAQYEMTSAASPIPDRVTIERILPEKLTYILHSGDVDFRDTITRDQLDLDGTTFSPVDFDDTGEDSMDTFPGEEMPPRPGDDALPQEDDLSSPSTVMSSVEPVSLETYTGSFQGDKVDDRSWLLEGDSSAVEVDPALMAKVAGKNFSPREQREFIEEKGEARNLDLLDLAGTHYIDEELHTSDSLW